MDVNAWLDAAALPERTVEVCLRGDLVARIEELERQAEQVDRPGMLHSGAAGLTRQIEALQAEMRAATRVVRLRALPRREYTRLVAQHPPRDGDTEDRALGWNAVTFPEALVRACLVDPPMTDDQWARFVNALTQAQYDHLALVAWELNKRDVTVPFSFAVSRSRRTSGDEPRRRSDSGSPSAGSTGGRRGGSRRTSGTIGGESSGR